MHPRKRTLSIAVGVALAALFALIPVVGATSRAQETKNVNIQNFAFDPLTISVNVGDTVTWKNSDTAPHTATASDKSFDSGRLDQNQEFSFTFTTPGTFQYVCAFHDMMPAGTIEVQAVNAPAAAPAAPAAAPAAQPAPTGSVDAADQPVVNRMITVANVTASADGWIVAHLDEGGRPGRVLGHTAVKAGENSNLQIALSEDVAAGAGLWPMLHVDLGAPGAYEFPGADVPVRDSAGGVVMKMIMVTGGAAAPAQPPAAPAQPPAALPRTAGEELPLAAAVVALAALLLGARLRVRRA